MSIENAVNAIATWAQASNISSEGRDLSPFLTAAVIVAAADGMPDENELSELNQVQSSLTGRELSPEDLQNELNYINDNGQAGAIAGVASAIEDANERGFAVSFAAVIAASMRGVNAKEGAALQALGQGLGFSSHQVLEILGQAMKAVQHGVS